MEGDIFEGGRSVTLTIEDAKHCTLRSHIAKRLYRNDMVSLNVVGETRFQKQIPWLPDVQEAAFSYDPVGLAGLGDANKINA